MRIAKFGLTPTPGTPIDRLLEVPATRAEESRVHRFGKPDEVYLAHLVTRAPDFDHIVRVTLDDAPSNESLRHGLTLVIPSLRNHQKEEELDAIIGEA